MSRSKILTLSTGVQIEASPVPSLSIKSDQMRLEDPKVPLDFIEGQDRYEENPFKPSYKKAVQRVAIRRMEIGLQSVIHHGCRLVGSRTEGDGWLRAIIRSGIDSEYVLRTADEGGIDELFIMYRAIATNEDMTAIVEATCITMGMVDRYIRQVDVSRNGDPILEAMTRHSLETGIGINSAVIGGQLVVSTLDEYNACIASRLSWVDWREGSYTVDQMVEVIALNRLNSLIDMHKNDAQISESERKSKNG